MQYFLIYVAMMLYIIGATGIDLVFAIDESSSIANITSDGFDLIREFAANISSTLDIGLQGSLVGVILFSSNASIEFNVTRHTDEASLLTAIDNLPYRGGGTNIAAALDLLRTAGQPGGALNLRNGFTHIAALVIDGVSNDQNATLTAANALHSSNIYDHVYAISVSEAVNAGEAELRAIASDPSLVFSLSNFDGLVITEQTANQQAVPSVGKLLIAWLWLDLKSKFCSSYFPV